MGTRYIHQFLLSLVCIPHPLTWMKSLAWPPAPALVPFIPVVLKRFQLSPPLLLKPRWSPTPLEPGMVCGLKGLHHTHQHSAPADYTHKVLLPQAVWKDWVKYGRYCLWDKCLMENRRQKGARRLIILPSSPE